VTTDNSFEHYSFKLLVKGSVKDIHCIFRLVKSFYPEFMAISSYRVLTGETSSKPSQTLHIPKTEMSQMTPLIDCANL